MTTNKFLTITNGTATLTQAPASSAGADDANKLISTNSSGLLDVSFLPSGVELQVVTLPTSENLTAGDFVNIFSNSGVSTARKADASNNRPAIGYVLTSVTSPANAQVYVSGRNTAVVGGEVGPAFLSATTPGGFSSTPPATPGANVILQRLGNFITPTSLLFENDPIVKITV